jgi:tetratricopeptide (TPR) repeat protein
VKRLACLFLLVLAATGAAYEWGGPARRGVRELRKGNFDDALRAFREGRSDLPGSAVLPYDEALAHLGKGAPDSAAVRFQEAMTLKGDHAREAAAYNLGNLSMRAKDARRAVQHYKEALRTRPDDLDAKKNLEEALRRIRESSPEQRKSPPSGGPGPPTPGGGEKLLPRPSEGGKNEQPATPRPGDFTKQEAERWLESLESERRAKRQQGKSSPQEETGKRDW